MPKTITFNELRRIKASLPEGSTHVIAEKLNLSVQTVRNYFGGSNYAKGRSLGPNTAQQHGKTHGIPTTK